VRNCNTARRIILYKQRAVIEFLVAEKEIVSGAEKETRGAGFLNQESYDEAITQHPKARNACNVNQAYRVVLAQQQLQMIKSDELSALNDPLSIQVDTESPTINATLQQQIASTPKSFRLTADLVNSISERRLFLEQHRDPIVMSSTDLGSSAVAVRAVLAEGF
jgi:hypothetical protein